MTTQALLITLIISLCTPTWAQSPFTLNPLRHAYQGYQRESGLNTQQHLLPDQRLASKADQIKALKSRIGPQKKINFKCHQFSLDKFLSFFANEYDLNIINDAQSSKKLSFDLKQIHPIDLLNTVLQSWHCDWNYKKNVIRIASQTPIKVYKLNWAKVSDVLASISQITSLTGISIHESNNALIAKGDINQLEQLDNIIQILDTQPQQVLIEAKIIETSMDVNETLGVGIHYQPENSDAGTNTHSKGFATDSSIGTTGLFIRVLHSQIQANIESLITNAESELLANPKLLVTNHNTAKILTGEEMGFSTSTSTATSTIQNIEFMQTGISLEFTPHITDKQQILMEIIPEISDGRIESNLPRKTTTKTETQVAVNNGQTIVIGGLIQNKKVHSTSRIPFLSKIPILKVLFKRNTQSDQKKEIVILITPHIVNINQSETSVTGAL